MQRRSGRRAISGLFGTPSSWCQPFPELLGPMTCPNQGVVVFELPLLTLSPVWDIPNTHVLNVIQKGRSKHTISRNFLHMVEEKVIMEVRQTAFQN